MSWGVQRAAGFLFMNLTSGLRRYFFYIKLGLFPADQMKHNLCILTSSHYYHCLHSLPNKSQYKTSFSVVDQLKPSSTHPHQLDSMPSLNLFLVLAAAFALALVNGVVAGPLSNLLLVMLSPVSIATAAPIACPTQAIYMRSSAKSTQSPSGQRSIAATSLPAPAPITSIGNRISVLPTICLLKH